MNSQVSMDLGFQPINSLANVTPFVGKYVAYKANSFYWIGSSKEDIHFGTIYAVSRAFRATYGYGLIDSIETGYDLERLKKHGDNKSGPCALIESIIKRFPISMRLATEEEIDLIRKLVINKQANW